MSARSPPDEERGDSTWLPDAMSRSDVSSGVEQVRRGLRKAGEGTVEALGGVVVLLGALWIAFRKQADDSGAGRSAQSKLRAWRHRVAPIQQRFEEAEVTDEDVEQAIEWARSE